MEDARRDLKGIDFIKYDDVRIHNMRKMNLQRVDKFADRPGAHFTTAACTSGVRCTGNSLRMQTGSRRYSRSSPIGDATIDAGLTTRQPDYALWRL